MTLKQLEAFYFAATLGSFALAAQRVHVTQSSLSKRIAELEAWVGAELFSRSGKRAHLTEAGHRLLRLAAEMLELKESARGALDAPARLSGTCRFGISELGALTWLPNFVARVRKDHPGLALRPHVDLGRRLERQVVRGELDFAIVPGPPEDSSITSYKVGDVRFAWIAAPGRFRAGKILKSKDLSRHPVITMTEGSGLTQAFDAWAAAQGLRIERIVASNSLMAIIGLTIADVGLSFLPQSFMRPWVQGGALLTFRSDPPLPTLPYCFMQREDDRRALLPILRDCIMEVAQYSTTAGYSRKIA
ncbi:LysR family transcriptional regulator [Bradyrhizobium sp. HKCCYLS20291]|uniref:LysR family transcriptional regulator n=1 Tax=Bradyrhizobium sp. HKCCYLS20291 TaxID=3420766 RepID=UPI003EBD77E5